MSEEKKLRVVVVDDEEPSRRKLKALISKRTDLALVAECATAVEALKAMKAHQPDLVFLDIRLPDLDGFEILDLSAAAAPDASVIFVTAFDEFAVRAFEVGAVDYLLKPVDPEGFSRAVDRTIARLAAGRTRAAAVRETDSPESDGVERDGRIRRILARDGSRLAVVPVELILRFEGDGNYVRLHCEEGVYRVRATMTMLEQQLDPDRFFRIHRSTIVNLEFVRDLTHIIHGDYQVRMSDGGLVTLTGARRDAFTRALEGHAAGVAQSA
jgi:two-component system LytT family response regulator